MLVGIDYGSKMAGTTVIAYTQENEVHLMCSEKKQDADQMIMDFVSEHQIDFVGIDAPLSLPKVYTGKGEDYFYRECDKSLQAMSPMFLGGLTARAMKLNAQVDLDLKEVYPGALARELDLKEFDYKGKNPNYQMMLERLNWNYLIKELPNNSHQMDAILALFIVCKIKIDQAKQVGDADEGLIYY